MNPNLKIQSFTDLITWQKGHELVLRIYKITKTFPREETYSLVDQMRRCVISITSNIAEGFSRKSYKEKIQFYSMALGSTTELQNQILVAKDVGYITQEQFLALSDLMLEIHKLYNYLYSNKLQENITCPLIGIFYTEHGGNYQVVLPIKKTIPIKKPFKIKTLLTVKCISIIHRGSYKTIEDSFNLLKDYVKKNNLVWKFPVMEYYIKSKGSEKNYLTEIQVPI